MNLKKNFPNRASEIQIEQFTHANNNCMKRANLLLFFFARQSEVRFANKTHYKLPETRAEMNLYRIALFFF